MSRGPEPKSKGPVLEVRFIYRAEPNWIPGSLEVYETIQLPIGHKALDAAAICYDVLMEFRRRLTV